MDRSSRFIFLLSLDHVVSQIEHIHLGVDGLPMAHDVGRAAVSHLLDGGQAVRFVATTWLTHGEWNPICEAHISAGSASRDAPRGLGQVLRPALIEIDRFDLFVGDRTAMFSIERSPC
jgi:hypothetical protein